MLKHIKPENLKEVLTDFYKRDQEFTQKYVLKSDEGFDSVIDFNLKQLEGMSFDLYQLDNRGFFCLVEDPYVRPNINLLQFFVCPNHRKDGTKEELMKLVIEKAGNRGVVAIVLEKNKPINNFYKKHGKLVKAIPSQENTYMIYSFEGAKLWL